MSDSPQSAQSAQGAQGAKASVNDAEYEWLYGGLAETAPGATPATAPDDTPGVTPDVTADPAQGPVKDTSPAGSDSASEETVEDADPRPAAPQKSPAATPVSDLEVAPEDAAGTPAAPTSEDTTVTAAAPARPPIAALIVVKTLASRLKIPAMLAAVFAAWMALGSPMPGASPDSNPEAGTARNAMADPVMSQALNDQKAAETYLAKHGTLNGFTLRGKGVRFAASGSTFLASRLVGGVCYAYAWEGAGQNKPVQDATGAACTDEQITQAQIVLDEQSVALAEAADNQATAAFTAASATASQFAINNWVQGAPSLSGLGADIGSGVRVVENAGSWLVARYGDGTACRQTTIGADAAVGEITPCP